MMEVSGSVKELSDKADAYIRDLGRPENLYRLQAKEAVLLAVDMQNFVCLPEPGRELPNIEKVIASINLFADFCHSNGIPVVWLRQCFTRHGGRDDTGLYGAFHKQPLDSGMFNQGEATEIYPGMHLDLDRDFVVVKNRYSAFAPGSSRLESLLSGLGKPQIIMAGVATNVCVESTARDAMQRGYQVTVLTDATAAFDKLLHQISLLNIKLFFGDARPMGSVIRELEESI